MEQRLLEDRDVKAALGTLKEWTFTEGRLRKQFTFPHPASLSICFASSTSSVLTPPRSCVHSSIVTLL